MYNSIPENLTNKDLTTVIYFAVKMLNKYKNKENRDIKLSNLSINPDEILYPICNNLLHEIGVKKLYKNESILDSHIRQLYEILELQLQNELNKTRSQAKNLLTKFRTEKINKRSMAITLNALTYE